MPTVMSAKWGPQQAPGIGGFHWGRHGIGVRGDELPSTGQSGPSLQYPHIVLPAEAADEFRYEMVSVPPGLTLFQYDEDGVVRAEGPVGVYSGSAIGYKNGVSYGTFEFEIQIGAALSGTFALDELISVSGTLSGGAPSGLSGGVTLDDITVSGSLFKEPCEFTFTPALDDATSAISFQQFGGQISFSPALNDVTSSVVMGSVAPFFTISVSLLEVEGGFSFAPENQIVIGAVLDDVTSAIGLSIVPTVTLDAAVDDIAAAFSFSNENTVSVVAQVEDVTSSIVMVSSAGEFSLTAFVDPVASGISLQVSSAFHVDASLFDVGGNIAMGTAEFYAPLPAVIMPSRIFTILRDRKDPYGSIVVRPRSVTWRLDPDAVLDFGVDWRRWLGEDDTIISALFVDPTPGFRVMNHETRMGTLVAFWAQARDVVEAQARTVIRITTERGRKDDRTLNFIITQR